MLWLIMQESRIAPALSSMHPQMHTPISIYNIQQALKKYKFLYEIFQNVHS